MQVTTRAREWRIFLRKLNPIPAAWRERYGQYAARRPILSRIYLALGIGAIVGIGFSTLMLILLFNGAFGRIPTSADLKKIKNSIATEVYADDGELLGRYYIENRLSASMEEISPEVIHALVATEDARFYDHHGIDYRAWGRVIVKSILQQKDESGGGSTITQQLAKNLYPRKKFFLLSTPINKAKEIVIARRLEKLYSKEEILALYLNTIPFSGNVFGIKTAAMRFFDTTPDKLKAEQAAVLIGMLKATTAYHPIRNPERSKERRNTVLSRMVKYGYLPPEDLDSIQQLPLTLKYKERTHNDGIGMYFREHLRLYLEEELKKYTKPDGSSYNIYADGLKIYTTIDSKMQRYAEAAMAEEMRKIQASYFKHFKKHEDAVPYGSEDLLKQQVRNSERVRSLKAQGVSKEDISKALRDKVAMNLLDWKTGKDIDTLLTPVDSVKYYLSLLNAGFLAADPATGKIRAWVGGINFRHLKFDHVKSRRQVGSTFKPIVYAQAIRSGIKPCKNFQNKHIVYEEFDNWAPKNVDDKYGGWYNMEGALKRSINTIAVQVILEVGVDSVREMAKRMGISSPIPKEAGISLGGVDLTLYEMVNAFGTLANRGARPDMHYISRIETADGKPLQGFKAPNPKNFYRAMQESHADMMIFLLTKVVESSSGTAARLRHYFTKKIPVAAKTGTSNDQRDGWFIGFTPDLVFGAWVGGEQPQVRFQETSLGQGSTTAMPICANFLNQVYDDEQYKEWEDHKFPSLDSLTMAQLDCYRRDEAETLDSILPLAPSVPLNVSPEEAMQENK